MIHLNLSQKLFENRIFNQNLSRMKKNNILTNRTLPQISLSEFIRTSTVITRKFASRIEENVELSILTTI